MKEFDGKYVTIMSCSDCNTQCKHCYVSYKGNISGDKLYEICKELQNKYQLNINGTEVLLHKDYFKTYNLIGQHRLLSNGIVFNTDEEIINYIKSSSIEMVAMSYHFIIHKDISYVSQTMLENTIKKLQDNGVKVELMCTIDKDNYDKIEEICACVRKLNVKKVRFINLLKTGNALNLKVSNILSLPQKEAFFEQLYSMRNRYDDKDLLIKRCGSFGNDTKHPTNFECVAGQNSVVIAPDFGVYPCIYMVKPEYRIGYYEDGKVIIEQEIKHNTESCLASDCYNDNKRLVLVKI